MLVPTPPLSETLETPITENRDSIRDALRNQPIIMHTLVGESQPLSQKGIWIPHTGNPLRFVQGPIEDFLVVPKPEFYTETLGTSLADDEIITTQFAQRQPVNYSESLALSLAEINEKHVSPNLRSVVNWIGDIYSLLGETLTKEDAFRLINEIPHYKATRIEEVTFIASIVLRWYSSQWAKLSRDTVDGKALPLVGFYIATKLGTPVSFAFDPNLAEIFTIEYLNHLKIQKWEKQNKKRYQGRRPITTLKPALIPFSNGIHADGLMYLKNFLGQRYPHLIFNIKSRPGGADWALSEGVFPKEGERLIESAQIIFLDGLLEKLTRGRLSREKGLSLFDDRPEHRQFYQMIVANS